MNQNHGDKLKFIFDSKLLVYGDVMHKRQKTKINFFVYKVFYLCFDITKIDSLKSYFLSINKFNFFSFYSKDHGLRDGSNLELWIRSILDKNNLNHQVKKIFLFTHPRVFGYVFNPVSFWFCVNQNNELIAILFEVNNTFSQTHSYLIYNDDFSIISSDQIFSADKKLYVSPFFKVEGKYNFRVNLTANKIAIWIDYLDDNDNKNLLTSIISKDIKKLNDHRLLIAFISIPLMTFKVIFLIHWQALKLFVKKIKFISNPNKKNGQFSSNKKQN